MRTATMESASRGLSLDYVGVKVLEACRDLGLIDLLADGRAVSLAETARALGIPRHSARVLLLAACAYGVVEKRAATALYSLKILTSEVEPSLAFTKAFFGSFDFLTQSLRAGENRGIAAIPGEGTSLYARLEGHPAMFQGYRWGMDSISGAHLPLLVEQFRRIAPDARRLLDVGGSTGLCARALARSFAELEVTILDLPQVCRRIDDGGTGRIVGVASDIYRDPWPGGFDCVLLSHVLDFAAPEAIVETLTRANRSLADRKYLLVVNHPCNPAETGPVGAAVVSLYFLNLASGEGMCFPESEITGWMREAGFQVLSVTRTESRSRAPTAVYLAQKT